MHTYIQSVNTSSLHSQPDTDTNTIKQTKYKQLHKTNNIFTSSKRF